MQFLILFIVIVLIQGVYSDDADYLLTKEFGNFTHADLKSASSCGTVMATYNSISAYSGAYSTLFREKVWYSKYLVC
jgi:hypothetical protein